MYRGHHQRPEHGGSPFQGHETVEDQNERMEDELKGKISVLKSLTIEIGAEARDQNKLLRDTDDGFDSTRSLLGETMANVVKMARSGHRYHIYYLMLFAVFVFLVLWFYI